MADQATLRQPHFLADLIIYTGNVAPEQEVFWGSETIWLCDGRHGPDGVVEQPWEAVEMGLIYGEPPGCPRQPRSGDLRQGRA